MKLGSKIKYFLILFILSNNFSFADEKIINTPLINLKEIKPSFEEVLKGTENFEKVIIWGSSNTIITSGGNDRIELIDDTSSDYTIKKVGDDIHLDHKILDIKNIINGNALA